MRCEGRHVPGGPLHARKQLREKVLPDRSTMLPSTGALLFGIKGASALALKLSATLLALACLPLGDAQFFQTSAAVPQFNQFSLQVAPPLRPAQTNQCELSTTNSIQGPRGPKYIFDGTIQIAQQGSQAATVTLQPGQYVQSGASIVLLNQTSATSGVQIQNSTTSNVITLRSTVVSTAPAPPTEVYYGLIVNGSQSCSFGIRFFVDLSNHTTIDATSNSNLSLTAYAPLNSDPRRQCYVNGTQAGNGVQGPFNILVAAGETLTVTAPESAPLSVDGNGSTTGVGVYANTNGPPLNRVKYLQYIAEPGNIPDTYPLDLNRTSTSQWQCELSLTFIPVGVSAPATAPATPPVLVLPKAPSIG